MIVERLTFPYKQPQRRPTFNLRTLGSSSVAEALLVELPLVRVNCPRMSQTRTHTTTGRSGVTEFDLREVRGCDTALSRNFKTVCTTGGRISTCGALGGEATGGSSLQGQVMGRSCLQLFSAPQ